jgi:hypothetical protein
VQRGHSVGAIAGKDDGIVTPASKRRFRYSFAAIARFLNVALELIAAPLVQGGSLEFLLESVSIILGEWFMVSSTSQPFRSKRIALHFG